MKPAPASQPTGGPAPLGTHWPALDGLRGVAILLVILHHTAVPTPPHTLADLLSRLMYDGWVGVDLFFVLSGFLITGILFDAKGSDHALRNFYARRALRIFPLYYGTLLLVFALTAILGARARDDFHQALTHQRWFWLYGSNILFARDGWIAEPLTHFWSLAVEEHFYLIWPFVVLLLPRKRAMLVCALAMVAAPALRWALLHSDYGLGTYVLTPCRMDALAAGALLALACRGERGIAALVRPARTIALASGAMLAALVILKRGHVKPAGEGYEIVATAGLTLLAIFFATTLLQAIQPGQHALGAVLSRAPLRFLGKYSYGIYVFHGIFLPFLRQWAGPQATLAWTHQPLVSIVIFATLTLVSSTALAVLSWHLYEKQFLKLKQRFEYRGRRAIPLLTAVPAP